MLDADETSKVILFCGYDDMVSVLKSAARAYGHKEVAVLGGTKTKSNNKTQFMEAFSSKIERDEETGQLNDKTSRVEHRPAAYYAKSEMVSVRVLLMRFADAAGLNLTSADHVMFVHPHCTTDIEAACSDEMQAVARVRRMGQPKKVVTKWRFVCADTVEQDLVLEHRAALQRREDSKKRHRDMLQKKNSDADEDIRGMLGGRGGGGGAAASSSGAVFGGDADVDIGGMLGAMV